MLTGNDALAARQGQVGQAPALGRDSAAGLGRQVLIMTLCCGVCYVCRKLCQYDVQCVCHRIYARHRCGTPGNLVVYVHDLLTSMNQIPGHIKAGPFWHVKDVT